MKTFKNVMYDLGIIAATLVSMLLMLSLVGNTVLSFATIFLKTDKMEDVVESIDYSAMIMAEIEKSGDNNIRQMDDEIISELLETEMMEEIIEVCVENLFDELEGKKSELSIKEFKKIGNRYSDEIENLLKEHYEKSNSLSDDKIEEIAEKLIDQYAQTIVEMAPTAESLGLTDESIIAINQVKNGTYFWISIGITAGITLIIFLLLIVRLKGLLWLGIDYFMVAVGTMVSSFFVEEIFETLAQGTYLGMMDMAFVASAVSTNMIVSSIVMFILSILFIVFFIIGRRILKKKKAAKEEANKEVKVIENQVENTEAEENNESI